MVSFPPFRLDVDEERLWKGSKQVALRRKPFAILRYLAENPRKLVTHEELLAHVWGGAVVSESAVRSHMHELRQVLGEGLIETVIGRGYRFTAELADDGPTTVPRPSKPRVTDRVMVGRDNELGVLRAALDRAVTGHRQICFVTGEPGMGKTTLVDTFLDELAESVLAARGHCIEQHGTPEAYLAVIEMFGSLRSSERGEQMLAALVRYAPTFLTHVPHMIPDAQLEEVTKRVGAGNASRMLREVIEAIEAMCSQELLVLVFEDLQWSDIATIDLLAHLAQRKERAKLLVIATARRGEAATPSHPLNRAMRPLMARSAVTWIPIDRIASVDVSRLHAMRFPGHAFPSQLIDIVDRVTAGTPLFVTSFLDDLVGRGMIVQRDGQWSLAASVEEIAAYSPDSVKQLIDIQLDRLAPLEQRVLEAASLVGPEFSTALVAAALETSSTEDVDEICDGLVRRGAFLRRAVAEEWPDGTQHTRYAVLHAFVQEVSLQRTSDARKQRWHRLIAERLDAAYGEEVAEVSHVLALHYDAGNVPAKAVRNYVVAGLRGVNRFASRDAIGLFDRARLLLPRLPDGKERDALELRILQGTSTGVLRQNETTIDPLVPFERMLELARKLGDVEAEFGALADLAVRLSTLARYVEAEVICKRADALREAAAITSGALIEVHGSANAINVFWQGRIPESLDVFVPVSAAVLQPRETMHTGLLGPTDMAALMTIYYAETLWHAGYPESSIVEAERAVARGQASGDPYTLGSAICNLARIRLLRGDPPADVRRLAEIVLGIAAAEVWHQQAAMLVGWARSHTEALGGAVVDGLVSDFRARTSVFPMGTTRLGMILVGVLGRSKRTEQALEVANEMIEFARRQAEVVLEPELLRLKGELLESTDRAGAEAAYREALAIAATRGAPALELRAANRLARLANASPETLALVATADAKHSEGPDVSDRVEARRLLASRTTPDPR